MQSRRQGRRGLQVHRRPDGRAGHLHPDAGARGGQAVPDVASKTCSRSRAAARSAPAVSSAARCKVGDEVEIVGLMKAPKQDGRHRRRDVQQDAGRRHGRRQRRRAAARRRAHRPGARPGAGQARLDHAAHQVRGRGLRADARKKAAGTRRSSPATARSSTSAPPT